MRATHMGNKGSWYKYIDICMRVHAHECVCWCVSMCVCASPAPTKWYHLLCELIKIQRMCCRAAFTKSAKVFIRTPIHMHSCMFLWIPILGPPLCRRLALANNKAAIYVPILQSTRIVSQDITAKDVQFIFGHIYIYIHKYALCNICVCAFLPNDHLH